MEELGHFPLTLNGIHEKMGMDVGLSNGEKTKARSHLGKIQDQMHAMAWRLRIHDKNQSVISCGQQ